MFTNPLRLKPLLLPESVIGSVAFVDVPQIARLMRHALRDELVSKMPAAIIHYPYGEPETMLADVIRKPLSDEDGVVDPSVSYMAQLATRADRLTGAAQFLKLYPDRDLTRYVARGGLPPSMYSNDDPADRDPSAKAHGSVPQPRTLGQILTDAIGTTRDISDHRMKQISAPYYRWLDSVAQTIGRRPMMSEQVASGTGTTEAVFNSLLEPRTTIDWQEDVAKTILSLYYIYACQNEEALHYKSDYSSSMFTRFVSVRMRDYAALYSSAAVIEQLLEIRLHEMSVNALLGTLGDTAAPATTIADLRNSIAGALTGERVRLSAKFLGMVDDCLLAFRKSTGVDHLMMLDPETTDIFSQFTVDSDWRKPMPINPEYSAMKVGPIWVRKHLDGRAIEAVRASAIRNLRTALRKVNSLAASLPPLEQGSNAFDMVPSPVFYFPPTDQPRFTSVGDEGPYSVGVSSVEVDANGALKDKLLPHMGKLFNYTAYATMPTTPYASRLLKGGADPTAGLPAELSSLPVPINYMEGEKSVPVILSHRDLPEVGPGVDYLRRLEAIICSLGEDEMPYVLSQIAAAFIVLVKGDTSVRVRGAALISLDNTWSALTIPTKMDEVGVDVQRLRACFKQYTYGVPTAVLIKDNLEHIDISRIIKHVDATVSIALSPLSLIPRARTSTYHYEYVHASYGRVVPVSVLTSQESKQLEKAHFSSIRADRHGQNWYAVPRLNFDATRTLVQQPGVLVAYTENIVGYLSEEALVGSPSPWKAPATAPVTQELPAVEMPAEVVATAEAPAAPEEKV